MRVRPATPDDLPRLARTLAEAFTGDPVWTWMVPSLSGKRREPPMRSGPPQWTLWRL
ncbi:MAG TPA: hypothetical protein VFC19_07630 [Candidatus Limnocylindrales bacterium]|nr:hypothetical protein [Candidatus Limnocylindrales bacterium]